MTECERFARWLDEGMPGTADAGLAHAASCTRCGSDLAAARALETALAGDFAAAPAGFAERVMARVATARPASWAGGAEADALPWWVRAAAEPSTALSLALGALVLWQRAALDRLGAAIRTVAGQAVASYLQQQLAPRLAHGLGAFADPLVITGLGLAMLPLAWWAGLAVYHWSGDPPCPRTARR